MREVAAQQGSERLIARGEVLSEVAVCLRRQRRTLDRVLVQPSRQRAMTGKANKIVVYRSERTKSVMLDASARRKIQSIHNRSIEKQAERTASLEDTPSGV